jgi:hypothetical protein
MVPFDDALGWGAGERISRQISNDDLAEIGATHEETVAPVSELPGLEQTEVPAHEVGAGVGPVEGLEDIAPGPVEPLAGLEATSRDQPPAEEPVRFVEPEPIEVVHEEIVPVVPDVPEESDEAMMDVSGEIVDRATAERRASLMGLPLLEGADVLEPEEPLVLDAEPEPVVTETMAEVYVRQGLVDEAREVYGRLLAGRPDDARLKARLAELNASAGGGRGPMQFDAAASGGRSARAMILAVLSARPSGAVAAPVPPTPEPSPAVATAARETPPGAPLATSLPEPMDEAFSEEQGDEALGAPTQPADDEVTLSAIFGEPSASEPSRQPVASRAPEPSAPGRTPGGFSFDEFFGKPARAVPASAGRPPRDTLSDDEGEEAFRDWLKGLKG